MAKISVVAIERQFCSGGSNIGKLVAQNLGCDCYDHELVDLAAKRVGVSAEEIKKFEEAVFSPFTTPLSFKKIFEHKMDLPQKIFAAQAELILESARKGPCVIVGRCADYVLKNVVPTLGVFVYSNNESRVHNATANHGISFDDVNDVLKNYDKKRAEFYNINTTKNWSSMQTYDLCLDSGRFGYEGCADIISNIVKSSK